MSSRVTRRAASHAAAATALVMVMVMLLGACSSAPPTRFHSLTPPPATGPASPVAVGTLAWEVLPVTVPIQVDQPQWVVRTVDGSLAVLEQERWIAPIADEIRAAVVDRLTQVLGAPAIAAEPRNRWRIRIDVKRFESAPGREARLEATWTLSSGAEESAALRCHAALVQVPSGSGYLALASGHQQGVTRLADAIGTALKALGAGQPAACAP